jgi:ABC-type sugar transport system ATPase subunit
MKGFLKKLLFGASERIRSDLSNDWHILRSIYLNMNQGDHVAILGAKGAGKSTFCQNLCGYPGPYSRKVYINEVWINQPNPAASCHDLRLITPLDTILISSLTVAENLFMGKGSRLGMVNWNKLNAEARNCLSKLGIETISFEARVAELQTWEKILIRIARSYLSDTPFIVLDEVSTLFPDNHIEQLFVVIRNLKTLGVSVFYIPYRIEEISEIADKVAILYKGEISGGLYDLKDVSYERIINIMMGQDLTINPFTDYFIEKYRITDREKEIISMIGNGFSNQFIAEKLELSLGTVKNHIYNIFQKTHVRNRIELCNLLRLK